MKAIPLLTVLICFSTLPAHAEGKRIALVIGNGAYTHVPTLANPTNDSREVSKLLRTAGYEVTEVTDGTVKEMGVALRTFAIAGREAEAAVFYFAGHGFEVGGKNYLAPVDAELAVDEALSGEALDAALGFALDAETVPLDGVLGEMRKQMTGLKIVVLDCCRNNPFAGTRSWARSRSGGGGLAQVTEAELPEGTMLVFSGEPGQEVPDGTGDHSPFAEALLGEMKGAGQAPVLTVFTGVATKVKGRQKPWIKFDGTGRSLHAFSTVALMTRGVPVAVKAEEPDPAMSEAEIERRAKEMAEKLVAEAMRKQPVPAMPATAPAAPVMPTETPKPMVKTDPVPAPAYPADRGMEGSRAGEVREFGGIEMVWCPPGEFWMGSPEDEDGRIADETQQWVTLTRGFWMAETECTQGQWESVTGENPSEFKGEVLPVEMVSWHDVQGWLVKMNEKTPLPSGWKWALPTEAQWEYACRAGTATPFAGDLDEMAWYGENSGGGTNAVATKMANAWGIFDMHGNVWEWCGDWYGVYPGGSATDPTGDPDGSYPVSRGGDRNGDAASCRSANRNWVAPGNRSNNLGFRPAAVPADR
ncbi:MAG: SUMF1/EgtB/PvdO family nonheme iron enzyme [Verrucomicrobiales bacterium]|nr:SUMF1/EgtB/PvdO family nonheme iron enzyme [Verrucomicrobiales bacterium]